LIIGVAGFVLNDENEVLVVKERFAGPVGSRWKLPGGHADTGKRALFYLLFLCYHERQCGVRCAAVKDREGHRA